MRSRSFLLAGGLLCLSATTVQAGWGFGLSEVATAATPVESSPPPPAPASAFDDVGPLDSPFPEVVDASAPLPVPTKAPYDGLEFSLGPFVLHPVEYKMEGVLLASILLYTLLSFLGGRRSRAHARAWFEANESTFRQEFAGVGLGDQRLFQVDGGDEFISYATGRRGVVHAWSKLQTKARHDLFTRVYHIARGIIDYGYASGEDQIVIDFKLSAPQGTPGAKYCFAIADRKVLRTLRDSRWDLTTFTNISEYSGMDPSLIVMTESGDITTVLFKNETTGLVDAVKAGAPGLEYFESLIISDMPAEQPDATAAVPKGDEFHLILTLRLPPKKHSAVTAPFISLACNLADVIHLRTKLMPEITVTKLKRRRADAVAALQTAVKAQTLQTELEKKEAALALKKKLDKEKEEAKVAVMSKADRIKYQAKMAELERKKLAQKMAKKKGGK